MGGAATLRLEVGDGPDGRVPPASDRPQKGEGGAVLGRRVKASWVAAGCQRTRKKAAGVRTFAG
jgi:hypothetical protein